MNTVYLLGEYVPEEEITGIEELLYSLGGKTIFVYWLIFLIAAVVIVLNR